MRSFLYLCALVGAVIAQNATTSADDAAATASPSANARTMSTLSSTSSQGAIDVHMHAVPSWYQALVPTTGGSPTPAWTIQNTFTAMAAVGASRAILSLSTPMTDVVPGNCSSAASIATRVNNEFQIYAKQYSNISWYFHLPLPCQTESLAELARVSKLSPAPLGMAMLTSYGTSTYMGNSSLASIYSALNSAKTVIFVHPHDPLASCNGKLYTNNPVSGLVSAALEFYQETARGFADLIRADYLVQYSNLKWISAQMGGHLPPSLNRLYSVLRLTDAQIAANNDALQNRVFYDTAGPTIPAQAVGLLGTGVSTSQIVFGTDFPYAPQVAIVSSRQAIDTYASFSSSIKNSILYGNAKKLFGL